MKQSDVIIGHTYEARVSGRMVRVFVLAEAGRALGGILGGAREARGRRRWRVRSQATGREIMVTAARLRVLPKTRAAVERVACSHCGKLAEIFTHAGQRRLITHGTRASAEPGAEIVRCAGSREAVLSA